MVRNANPARHLHLYLCAALTVLTCPVVGEAQVEARNEARNETRDEPRSEVEALLAAEQPPPGVVFEVVTGDEAALAGALPAIRGHVQRLRGRFPGLAIAVLTHGSEQFSLLTENARRYPALHELTLAFGRDDGIAVQVCGNHAAFRNVDRRDFPDYVEVVASAPGALAAYRAAGFVVIVM